MKNKLFNPDVKLEYLENQTVNESTKRTMIFEFINSAKIEKQLSKDVYAFNDLEIDELLNSLRSSNVISLRKTLSILNSYVKWCIENGKRGKYENNINNIDAFVKTEGNLNKYVSNKQLSSKILAKDELSDLIHILVNPVDQAIIQCMYEFIGGEKLHELRSLKYENINFNKKTIILTDIDGTARKQNISNKLINILNDVKEAKMYIYNNGIMDDRGNVSEREFALSNYLIRPNKTKGNDYQIISYNSILGRLRKIRQFTGYYHITSNSLKETRIIHEISDVVKERNLFEPDNLVYEEVRSRILKEYGVKISPMQEYTIKQKYNQIINIKDF